jgi:phosphohistidine phosphatase SixA
MINPPGQDPAAVEKDEEPISGPFAPARIILLRHAEKTGMADDRGLSLLGKYRAQSLAVALPQYFGPISRIIAARSTVRSERPVQTVEPLAAAFDLPVDTRWNTNDYAKLAHELANEHYRDSQVLICWRHKTMQQLARSLGAIDAPPWPESVYERILVLTPISGRSACIEFRTPMKAGKIKILPRKAG